MCIRITCQSSHAFAAMNGVILFSFVLFIGQIAVIQFWSSTIMGAILFICTSKENSEVWMFVNFKLFFSFTILSTSVQ